MIEVYKIEDFIIWNIFMPYNPSLCLERDIESIQRKLRRNPEYIIQLLEENPDVKERAFRRLEMFGGVKWYRYLDMSNLVIRWVNENLEE